MRSSAERPYTLSFTPAAWQTCFLVADILANRGKPWAEYGAVGLATRSHPLHVVKTVLLPRQRVNAGLVYQPGRAVLALRDEIDALSRRMRTALVPVTFVHRHIGACFMSRTDEEFLFSTFSDQLSTVLTFTESWTIGPGGFGCCCPAARHLCRQWQRNGHQQLGVRMDFGLAFSLIVNQDRDYGIYAVRTDTTPCCGRLRKRLVPAAVALDSGGELAEPQRQRLRRAVEIEADVKITVTHVAETAREA
jgi:hypothetical protein